MFDVIYNLGDQLLQSKLRLVCTSLSILISSIFMLLVLTFSDALLEGINQNIEHKFPSLARSIYCNIQGSNEQSVGMKLSEIEGFLDEAPYYIKDIIRVSEKKQELFQIVRGKNSTNLFKGYGVSPGYQVYKGVSMLEGRFITEKDCREARRCVVVSNRYLVDSSMNSKDIVGSEIQMYNNENHKWYSFIIVGVFESTQENEEDFYCPYSLLNTKDTYINLNFIVDERAHLEMAKRYIYKYMGEREILDTSYSYYCMENKMVSTLASMMHVIKIVFTIIAILTLFMSVVGIANITMSSVFERTNEIGIKKAIGCTNQRLYWEILIENIMMCVIGVGFGILFTCGIIMMINNHMGQILQLFSNEKYEIQLQLGLSNVLLTVVLLLLVSICASYYPAKFVEKLPIVEALSK